MKKRRTYAEAQYKKAYAIVREANHTPVGSDHEKYLREVLDFEIEESYVAKAIKTASMRLDRADGGIAFWATIHAREAYEKENYRLGMKIRKHVNNYFLPF